LKSNFKNTIVFPQRFLGLEHGTELLKNESKWLYCPIIDQENKKFGFEVKFRGEKRVFTPEQIVGMILQKIKQTMRSNNINHNDIVLTVPSYYTQNERKALLNAAKIADLNVMKLLSESTAGTSLLLFSHHISRPLLRHLQKSRIQRQAKICCLC
jgi:molecular chaperone DnaK (HSP70)